MLQIFVEGCDRVVRFEIPDDTGAISYNSDDLALEISKTFNIPLGGFYVTTKGGNHIKSTDTISTFDLCTLSMKLRLCGGIDFQHREGSKIGGGGMYHESESNAHYMFLDTESSDTFNYILLKV